MLWGNMHVKDGLSAGREGVHGPGHSRYTAVAQKLKPGSQSCSQLQLINPLICTSQ